MTLTPALFQKQLFHWFDQFGRKHLPWQQNKTPYGVWLSEIMLQQTQVSTVIPYFERFMQTFPNLAALANAQEDEVLHLWAGLGYYSRARNLQRAAKMIMEKWQGEFPKNLADLQLLPGIGLSTAGAILSLAFNQATAILDGNVKRVLSRFEGIKAPINEKAGEALLWQLAQKYLPNKRAADYTQALMDLGATICTRRQPACSRCPLIDHCVAYQEELVDQLPYKKAAKPLPTRKTTFFIFKTDDTILLYKRPNKGIWGGLWSLPEMPGEPEKESVCLFSQQHFQLKIKTFKALASFRHTFTHYHLIVFPILISCIQAQPKIMAASQQIWYNPSQPGCVGLPKPIQAIIRGVI